MSDKQYMLTDFDSEVGMLEKINDQQATIERLKEIAKRTEEEKEYYADLYNKCRRLKLSDESIKQAYADLNRREREKHSQGNATYVSKRNQNEVIYCSLEEFLNWLK